jgi:hypothetical protein
MAGRRFLALAFLLGPIGACGTLIGEKDLVVDPAAADASSAAVTDVQAPDVSAPMPPPVEAGGVDATLPDGAPAYKRVFLTSQPIQPMGKFGGTGAADAFCRAAATTQGLGSDWVAWLSDSQRNAIDQISAGMEYRLLDGTLVAAEKTDLVTKGPAHAITTTETKQVLSDPKPWVWTGTQKNGLKTVACSDWSDSNPAVFGMVGSFTSPAGWTDNGGPGPGFSAFGCQTVGRLYCFEK